MTDRDFVLKARKAFIKQETKGLSENHPDHQNAVMSAWAEFYRGINQVKGRVWSEGFAIGKARGALEASGEFDESEALKNPYIGDSEK